MSKDIQALNNAVLNNQMSLGAYKLRAQAIVSNIKSLSLRIHAANQLFVTVSV